MKFEYNLTINFFWHLIPYPHEPTSVDLSLKHGIPLNFQDYTSEITDSIFERETERQRTTETEKEKHI